VKDVGDVAWVGGIFERPVRQNPPGPFYF